MSEPAGGPGAPVPGRDPAAPGTGYRRLIGAHRALGAGGPSRGYLFTVALLAGTASMPILAAISTGSATLGHSALPDASTPFIPTPSVGPVVLPLPEGTQPPALPSRTPVATAQPRPARVSGDRDRDHGPRRRSRPAVPVSIPGPVRTTPSPSPRLPRVPSPSPSPSASGSATPSPSPTGEPTSTFSDPATDLPSTIGPEPTPTDSAGSPPPAVPVVLPSRSPQLASVPPGTGKAMGTCPRAGAAFG